MLRDALRFAVLSVVACSGSAKSTGTTTTEPVTPEPVVHVKVDDLTSELEKFRAEHELPALAASIWRDGALIASGVVGARRADEPDTKATLDDRWHLGSNTKAMTATLIGIYVDRAMLRWEDTVAKLFPGVTIDPGFAGVTLEQLVQHRGGAPATPPAPLWEKLWADAAKPDARTAFVRGILAAPPAQPPGTFVYSNAGYMIAGAALERVTGKPWEQLMRDDLFTPLGMTSCGFGPPSGKDQPWGHDAGGAPMAPTNVAADNPPGLGPAGTVHCSLPDYGKFLQLHAGARGAKPLVAGATLVRLHSSPEPRGYAGGWLAWTGKLGRALAHSGSNTLWHVTAVVLPDRKLVFVVATNRAKDMVEAVIPPLLERYAPPDE